MGKFRLALVALSPVVGRAETENDSDLIPYWIYKGPVKVERRVPMLPFSRYASL